LASTFHRANTVDGYVQLARDLRRGFSAWLEQDGEDAGLLQFEGVLHGVVETLASLTLNAIAPKDRVLCGVNQMTHHQYAGIDHGPDLAGTRRPPRISRRASGFLDKGKR